MAVYASLLVSSVGCRPGLFAMLRTIQIPTYISQRDLASGPRMARFTYLANHQSRLAPLRKVGPLLVMHAMSVHNTMVWEDHQDTPQMLIFQRHSGYSADEVANPDIINFLTQNTNPVTGQSALDSGNHLIRPYRRSFQQLCYGG